MPRIPPRIEESVVYIYPDESSAMDGKRAGGSGFIVGALSETVPGRHWPFAVTNRHVIQGCGEHPAIRLNLDVKGTPVMGVSSTLSENWFVHASLDDVVVHPISLNSFMVASRGKPGWVVNPEPKDALASFRHNFIAEETLLTKEMVDELDIAPGDDVFSIGRFFSHDGRQTNQPSVRFGNISMMPGEPIEQEGSGFKQESFVVECRSIAGFSGSPVWVYIPPFSYDRKEQRTSSEGWWQGPWLLGVDWGHLRIPEDVVDLGGKKHPDELRVLANSGMMGVVPAWKLKELLHQEEPTKWRRDADANVAKKAAERTASESIPPR